MRILLDESLPRHLTSHLHPHDVSTVQQCGWAGKENGELLAVAELRFDLLLTADQNLPFQQHLPSFSLAVMILHARSNRLEDLLPLLPNVHATLETVTPHQVIHIPAL